MLLLLRVFDMGRPLSREVRSVFYNVQYTIHFTVWDLRLPQPGGLGPCFISPRNRVARLYPQALGFPSFTPLLARIQKSRSHVTTNGQLASLSWNKAPIWDLRPDFYHCQTVAGLLMWGALSNERTGLSFTIAPGPCQHRHFRVRLPWDS
jgi:hypothetical protein